LPPNLYRTVRPQRWRQQEPPKRLSIYRSTRLNIPGGVSVHQHHFKNIQHQMGVITFEVLIAICRFLGTSKGEIVPVHVLKAYSEVEVKLHESITSEQVRREWSSSSLGHLRRSRHTLSRVPDSGAGLSVLEWRKLMSILGMKTQLRSHPAHSPFSVQSISW